MGDTVEISLQKSYIIGIGNIFKVFIYLGAVQTVYKCRYTVQEGTKIQNDVGGQLFIKNKW